MFKWKDMFFNVLPLTVLKRKRERKLHIYSFRITYNQL